MHLSNPLDLSPVTQLDVTTASPRLHTYLQQPPAIQLCVLQYTYTYRLCESGVQYGCSICPQYSPTVRLVSTAAVHTVKNTRANHSRTAVRHATVHAVRLQ